jgi:chromosome segregation ATPase
MKRSELLKWLSKVVEKVEHLDTAKELDTKAGERISELEAKLHKLERRHEALLARYNELEVRWPTLVRR